MPEQLECDICIVGTGAAGGILAYRLARRGVHVLSLEQGGRIENSYFTNEARPQGEGDFGIAPDTTWPILPNENYYYGNVQAHRLYADAATTSTTPRSSALFSNRQIFRLNGKMNLWNAVALRYSRRDFRGREYGDSDVNWPIGYDDLAPHYSEIERLIGVCGTCEGLDELPDGEFIPPLPLRPADKLIMQGASRVRGLNLRVVPNRKAVETRPDRDNRCRHCGECIYGCSAGSVYKFSDRLLPEIKDRENYRLRCHSKVVRLLRQADSGRIDRLEGIDTQTREPFHVKARIFVLCAGALETPRLLINSRDESFPDGLANGSGLVGRYLQDKVKAIVGASLWRLAGDKTPFDPGFSDNVMIPRYLFDHPDFRGGYQAQVCHFLPKRPWYLEEFQKLPVWTRHFFAKLLFRSYVALMFLGKPEASLSNRVLLSEKTDKFGVPQVDVEYRFSDRERKMQQWMIRHGVRILEKSSGIGLTTLVDPLPGGAIHYAGTCRMAAVQSAGVVDADLRTFDHENLYLCDGSVFPDVSEKNLTLTIMALANRLAAHLQ